MTIVHPVLNTDQLLDRFAIEIAGMLVFRHGLKSDSDFRALGELAYSAALGCVAARVGAQAKLPAGRPPPEMAVSKIVEPEDE